MRGAAAHSWRFWCAVARSSPPRPACPVQSGQLKYWLPGTAFYGNDRINAVVVMYSGHAVMASDDGVAIAFRVMVSGTMSQACADAAGGVTPCPPPVCRTALLCISLYATRLRCPAL